MNGDALVANGNLISGHQKLWDVFNKDAAKTKSLFAQEYDAALKPGGDYIYYSLSKLIEPDKEFPKVSFIYGLPDLRWLVGAGVYLDGIESDIADLQRELAQQQRSGIQRTILVTGAISILVLILFYFVSLRLKKDLDMFLSFFSQAANEDKVIDCSKIYFDGLST